MDLNIIDQYGLPIAMLVGFGWYIIQRTKFLEETLSAQIDEDMGRLEAIIVAQLRIEEVKGYIEGLNDILAKIETINKKGK